MLIDGGVTLNGKVKVSGAKNSILPLLFSTLLAKGKHRFTNVPKLADVDSALKLLQELGASYSWEGNSLEVVTNDLTSNEAHYDIVRKMRASILCMGPLLARTGSASVSLPGGCAIGSRPIDLHLEAFQEMGASIENKSGYIIATAKPLKGANILFDITTVGGTENVMMAAVLAEGSTTIENAAKEPEIIDLAEYLNKMGANVVGAGTGVISITGVKELKPATHEVVPDRIEAGTLLIAGAITGGDVEVLDCRPKDIETLIHKLRESGFKVDEGEDWVRVFPNKSWKAVDITTAAHPGFPTDLQAQFMALMTVAQGTSVISETIFENRFMHVPELVRMGAQISLDGNKAVVEGNSILEGAPVMCTDLRASAALVLTSLVANGKTRIQRVYHVDRGYEGIDKKFFDLGAKIKRLNEPME
ncbi:MAG: UDP-N-acetylglucosamine 1-carboxyvinyltransferase [Bdellovibrionales bacterium]|nr:UDP-N-acetylglucosamine 1-carboxyvinyltransferase [Bdellovibrionales bacterium]